MSKSDEFETEEETPTTPKGDEKGAIQNNALLYMILKEGYKITINPTTSLSKSTKSPKPPTSLNQNQKQKGKKGTSYKCSKIVNDEDNEILEKEDIEMIGNEMNEIIQMKIKQKEKENQNGKEKDMIIVIEPKDLFTDGDGYEQETIPNQF